MYTPVDGYGNPCTGDVRRVDTLLKKEKDKHPDMSLAEIIR